MKKMKSILFILGVAFTIAITFSSCKKSYTCECEAEYKTKYIFNTPPSPGSDPVAIGTASYEEKTYYDKVRKKKVKCESYETTTSRIDPGVGYSETKLFMNCKLK